MGRSGWLTWLLIGSAGFLLGLFPLLRPEVYWLSLSFMILTFISLTVSWNIIGGYGGYLSFGHAGFFGIGLYTTALLLVRMDWSPFYTFPLGGAMAALFAALVGYPCLRLKGPYFALVTMILPLALRQLAINLDWMGGSVGFYLKLLPYDIFVSRTIFYEVMLAIVLLTVIIARAVENSKLGIGLFAIREDEEVAQTVGIHNTRLKMGAFILSAFLAGITGGIYAYYYTHVVPDVAFDLNLSLYVALMALFGGRDSWRGAVLGATVLTLASEELKIYAGAELSNLLYGALLIVVVVYLPDGLLSYLRSRGSPQRSS